MKGYLSCGGGRGVMPEKCRVLALSHTPKPRAPEPGRDDHITSGCENQRAFHLPGRDWSLLRTQATS